MTPFVEYHTTHSSHVRNDVRETSRASGTILPHALHRTSPHVSRSSIIDTLAPSSHAWRYSARQTSSANCPRALLPAGAALPVLESAATAFVTSPPSSSAYALPSAANRFGYRACSSRNGSRVYIVCPS